MAFKVEGVQPWFLTGVNKAILNTFKDNNLPVTMAVLANEIGADLNIAAYIAGALIDPSEPPSYIVSHFIPDWKVEIACNSYDYADYSNMTVEQQITQLNLCKQTIQGQFGVTPVTFTPPASAWNYYTETALRQTGFTHFSGISAADPGPLEYSIH